MTALVRLARIKVRTVNTVGIPRRTRNLMISSHESSAPSSDAPELKATAKSGLAEDEPGLSINF